jgi:hypothetical protein
MEVDLDKKTKRLTVRLTDEECLAIVSGGIFSSISRLPLVEVHPLSEIDSTSRALIDKDGSRVKNYLGSLITAATVNSAGKITLYIPESLSQFAHTNAEVLHRDEIKGDFDHIPHGGIRIELGEQEPLF